MPKVSGSNQPITAVVARAYGDQNTVAARGRLEFEEGLGDGEAG